MANATPVRPGQVDLSGDTQAMFATVYPGEVLTAFDNNVKLKERTTHHTIDHGKTATFPAMFKATGGYHTPGAELTGGAVAHAEVPINIDQLLVSDIFSASIDEAMNHFETRSRYAAQQGQFLALEYDKNIARNIILSSRAAALFTGDVGGTEVTSANSGTNALALASAMWTAKQSLEEGDVPVDSAPLHAALKPAQWYLLAQEPTLILNRDVDGDGSYSKGSFSMIGGIDVVKSNALPYGVNDTSNTDIPAAYRGDWSNVTATVFNPEAVATVQLMGLGMEMAPDPRRRGTLLIAEYAVGHGTYRSKCAASIKTS